MRIKISRSQWEQVGSLNNWFRTAQSEPPANSGATNINSGEDYSDQSESFYQIESKIQALSDRVTRLETIIQNMSGAFNK